MIRGILGLLAGIATVGAQVRQGGLYQITAETMDSGGGAASGGSYALRQALPALGAPASGGVYSILSGFTGQLGGTGTGGGTGSGPAAFMAWQTVIFGSPAAPGAGTYDDPDGDGIVNLLEFSFNLPPLTAGTPSAGPGATGGLPLIREEMFGPDRYFTMEFIQRKNAGLFLPETSTALSGWLPAAYTMLSGPEVVTPVYERVKLRIGPPLQPGGKLYYRLAVLIQ